MFLITSCTLTDFHKNYILNFDTKKHEFKKLIIPKGISIPSQKEEYSIPYQDKDLEKESYDIFPPI